ncbi:MAG: hypothetical protein AAB370_11215 [Verrucomicrobiota bacterium]
MKILGLVLAFPIFINSVLGCANITGSATSLSGTETKALRRSGVAELRYFLSKNLREDGIKMEASLRGSTNFNDRSDYSVALMYLGRSKEAVALLQRLEQERPGEYFVAANLGTAHELSGNNEEALRWINEGIRRNPDSHAGTEWLHAQILEAKILQQKDADYFKKHSVLELQADQIREEVTIGETKYSPEKLKEAIQHQLAERLQFVKPPDAPVAGLLFDYAAIEAATRTLESAKGLLQLAVEYGYPPDKVEPILKVYDKRIAWRKTKQYTRNTLIGIGVAAIAVFLLRALYKRGIFVLSSKDLKRSR